MKYKNNNYLFLFFFICILFFSCQPKPNIKISDNIEIALKNKYSNYIVIVNNALEGQERDMYNLLLMKDIHNAAGYDHGYILIELMKAVGDENYFNVLQKLDEKQKENVKQYFEVGLDNRENETADLFKKYPKTFSYLNFSATEKEMYSQ